MLRVDSCIECQRLMQQLTNFPHLRAGTYTCPSCGASEYFRGCFSYMTLPCKSYEEEGNNDARIG